MSVFHHGNKKGPPGPIANFPELLERYPTYLSTFADQSEATVNDTVRGLREFLQYIHYCKVIREKPSEKDAHKDMDVSAMDAGEICGVTQTEIEDYLVFLDVVTQNAMSTICKKLIYIRSMYAYLEKNAIELGITLQEGNPARDIPNTWAGSSVVEKVLTVNQIEKLMNGVTGETAERDKAIILLISTTGLTSSEVSAMDRDDIDWAKNLLRVHGNKSRTVYLTAACKHSLECYLRSRTEMEGEFLPQAFFTSSTTNHRLTPRAIQKRISKAAAVAGMGALNITAQDLRDTAAVMLLQGKSEQEKVRILYCLGYSSPSSIRRFQRLSSTKANTAEVMQVAVNNSRLATIGAGKDKVVP